jgi:hypothetical protein
MIKDYSTVSPGMNNETGYTYMLSVGKTTELYDYDTWYLTSRE